MTLQGFSGIIGPSGPSCAPVTVPLHLDVSKGITDLAQVLAAQFKGSSGDVLPQSLHFGGTRDGHDPRLWRAATPVPIWAGGTSFAAAIEAS